MKKTITITRTVELCEWPGCHREADPEQSCHCCERVMCVMCGRHMEYFPAETMSAGASKPLCFDCVALYPGGREALGRDLKRIRDEAQAAARAERDRGDKLMVAVFAGIKTRAAGTKTPEKGA